MTQKKMPVDISYLVADLKYSKEHGLKILEVQHGCLSSLNGDTIEHLNKNAIVQNVANFFDNYQVKKWLAGPVYFPLRQLLEKKGWYVRQSIFAIVNDPLFLKIGTNTTRVPSDPTLIKNMAAIVYATCEIHNNIDYYRDTYPGVLFIDAATIPYWVDKFKMNTLFNNNDELKSYKADWMLFSKNCDPNLVKSILEEMPAPFYVIKPRKEFLANGIIIVKNVDLENDLRTILDTTIEGTTNLRKHNDKKYSYWCRNKDDSFIIEKYYKSDYLCFSTKVGQIDTAKDKDNDDDEYYYDATMRIAFILTYDAGTISYVSAGGFWKLPNKAINEEGTLGEKHISFCKFPFYETVDSDLLAEVNVSMEKAMILLYKEMLQI